MPQAGPAAIDLSGRVALVTGASSGLGDRFARVLAAHGAHVVLAARRVDRLDALAAAIADGGGQATAVALDVADPVAIGRAVAEAESRAGPIDILVNNAGVSTTERLVEVTPEGFDHVFGTNVRGAFFVARAVAERMIARAMAAGAAAASAMAADAAAADDAAADDAALPPARIVNIASMAGLKALARIGVYGMSKAAVIQMTKAMALEWGRYGINVNAICPGYIRTELNDAHWETEAGRKLIRMMPRRRLGRPEDLDGLLLLLASDRSDFINGSVIGADDGFAL